VTLIFRFLSTTSRSYRWHSSAAALARTPRDGALEQVFVFKAQNVQSLCKPRNNARSGKQAPSRMQYCSTCTWAVRARGRRWRRRGRPVQPQPTAKAHNPQCSHRTVHPGKYGATNPHKQQPHFAFGRAPPGGGSGGGGSSGEPRAGGGQSFHRARPPEEGGPAPRRERAVGRAAGPGGGGAGAAGSGGCGRGRLQRAERRRRRRRAGGCGRGRLQRAERRSKTATTTTATATTAVAAAAAAATGRAKATTLTAATATPGTWPTPARGSKPLSCPATKGRGTRPTHPPDPQPTTTVRPLPVCVLYVYSLSPRQNARFARVLAGVPFEYMYICIT
jgi:hypothetical protein